MSDDILDWLRRCGGGSIASRYTHAADEIERLRGVVASQLESIQNLGTAPHCPTCACRADQPDELPTPETGNGGTEGRAFAETTRTDQPSDDSVLEPGEEWWMDVAGVPVALSEWEPGARKRKAADPTKAAP